MTAEDDVTPVPASSIQNWDHEADVVIVGYGIAGAAAAVESARAGADVLVLERTGSWGGAASMAGGFVYLGGGSTRAPGTMASLIQQAENFAGSEVVLVDLVPGFSTTRMVEKSRKGRKR